MIGPNADNMYNQLGDYTAPQKPDKIITVLEGIRDKVSDMTEVFYTRGCYVRDTSWEDFENAVLMAKNPMSLSLWSVGRVRETSVHIMKIPARRW